MRIRPFDRKLFFVALACLGSACAESEPVDVSTWTGSGGTGRRAASAARHPSGRQGPLARRAAQEYPTRPVPRGRRMSRGTTGATGGTTGATGAAGVTGTSGSRAERHNRNRGQDGKRREQRPRPAQPQRGDHGNRRDEWHGGQNWNRRNHGRSGGNDGNRRRRRRGQHGDVHPGLRRTDDVLLRQPMPQPWQPKGISFSSQSNAYNAVKSRVKAGNGASSSFYSTVNSGSMPPGGPKLSSANLALIKGWIDAGALNN